MDKRAIVLTLDAHRRIRDAKKRAGVALSDVKRAVNAEILALRDSVTPKDEILAEIPSEIRKILAEPEIQAQFRGEKGDRGEQGERGPKGDRGDRGDAGKAGGKGELSLLRLRQKVPDTIVEATLVPAVAFKTANYTVAASDGVILVDTTAGAVTITMPLAVNVPRQVFTIKRIAGSANVTIARTGTDVFENGQTSLALTTALSAAELVADADRATYWVI